MNSFQVDAHVGKHLFEECLQRYLRGKTRILATHQLQYLKGADDIILLDQGKMHRFSNYHELLEAHPEYNCLIAEEKKSDGSVEESSIEKSKMRRQFSSSSTRVSMFNLIFDVINIYLISI